jgi:hypothetical protein
MVSDSFAEFAILLHLLGVGLTLLYGRLVETLRMCVVEETVNRNWRQVLASQLLRRAGKGTKRDSGWWRISALLRLLSTLVRHYSSPRLTSR